MQCFEPSSGTLARVSASPYRRPGHLPRSERSWSTLRVVNLSTSLVAMVACAFVARALLGSTSGDGDKRPRRVSLADPRTDIPKKPERTRSVDHPVLDFEVPAPDEADPVGVEREASRAGVSMALDGLDVSECAKPGGPTGRGYVLLTFAPDGTTTAAHVVRAPFAGTAVAMCVEKKFRSVRVRPQSGGPTTTMGTFEIRPACACKPGDPMCSCLQ